MAFPIFAALLLATALLRAGEVLVSWRRQAARPDAVVAEGALFPAMALLHASLVVLPLAEVVLLERPFVPWVAAIAGGALALATALRVWTLRTIGGAWNVRVVRPEEGAVVTTGPYRFVRHPNYLCVILEIAALPLVHSAFGSALVLSAWNAAVLAIRIRNEERVLMQIPAWREAFAGRARLLPGVL